MNFENMSNTQIIQAIAKNIDANRITKQISLEELSQKGGFNPQTYSNFVNNYTNIKLETLIDIFRGFGELDKLQNLFTYNEPFSPIHQPIQKPKRIHKKTKSNTKLIQWGEDK